MGGLEGVWGSAGASLGPYERRLGDVLGPLEAMLEPSGSQKSPKMESQMVPNRVPEATRAENDETLIFDDSTKDFNDSTVLVDLRQFLVLSGLLPALLRVPS